MMNQLLNESLVKLRHELHKHPEVSGQEKATAERITNYLKELKPDELITGIGGHGVIATFDSGNAGPALLFRAELDALPIQENNTLDYRSSTKGVSHKCGHDGHATILCGLAEVIAANKPSNGKVHLLFQPAEETGEGAKAMLADPKFDTIKPDFGIALHNFPGSKKHSIIVKDGIFTISTSSHIFHFKGYTSHASEPENGRNPSLAIADLLRESMLLNQTDITRDDFRLVTSIFTRIGSPAYGVSAGSGEVHFTIRAFDDVQLELFRSQLIKIAESVCERDGLELSQDTLQNFHASYNDPNITKLVRESATANNLDIIEKETVFAGGEDFGLFTAQFPCCMFGLGSGEDTPALHHPDYDFPDDIIETGVRMFESIVRKVLD